MNLDLFNGLTNTTKENNFIENFMKELSDYLSNKMNGKDNNLKEDINLREENCLYQVVDRSKDGVYLQNLKNNKIFEETDLPKELLDKISNDYILRYKNGKYIFEEQLTDDFFNDLIDISEIQE